jgi:hypothetical protein
MTSRRGERRKGPTGDMPDHHSVCLGIGYF